MMKRALLRLTQAPSLSLYGRNHRVGVIPMLNAPRQLWLAHHQPSWVSSAARYRFSCSAAASCVENDNEGETETATNPMNAFQILGVPQTFVIDTKDLKEKYRNLMSRYHPDHQQHQATVRSNDEDTIEADASLITHSYDLLSNPHQRAVHLLELLGKPITETSGGSDDSNTLVDMDFLMQVMQIREQVDQIISTNDTKNQDVDEQLKPLWRENNARLQETCEELQQAFGALDLERAQALTARLQYWNRIDETIREQLHNLE